jgi:hypothetical protein
MRAFSPRRSAVLALAGLLLLGILSGCGKGSGSQAASGGGGGGSLGTIPATRGVVGISTKNTTRLGGADPATNAAAVALAVYPGLTAATRPQAVVIVDEHNWPAALAASALASAPLGAPLLYANGNDLPEVSAQALQAMRPIGAAALGGAQVIRIGTTAAVPAGYRTETLPTPTAPASTAASVERLFRVVHPVAPPQVIVTATEAPRALQTPAAGLAAESATPLLLVNAAGVPAATAAAIKSLHRPTIYVVGPSAVSSHAYAGLVKLGPVVHVVGTLYAAGATGLSEAADPVQNAISVSRFQHGSFGWGVHEAGHGLVFANASSPLDGPASASLSAHGDYAPLLLLDNGASVPAALAHYLSNIEPGYTAAVPPVREVYNHGWLIGDEASISALAQAEIDTVLEIAPRKPTAEEPNVAPAE